MKNMVVSKSSDAMAGVSEVSFEINESTRHEQVVDAEKGRTVLR